MRDDRVLWGDLLEAITRIERYARYQLIAAISQQLVLVTDNLDEFGRVQGLRLENWRLR